MIGILRNIGVRSEVMYALSITSIGASIAAWAAAKQSEDKPSAQRWGIFIGLWAPTFTGLGNALRIDEK